MFLNLDRNSFQPEVDGLQARWRILKALLSLAAGDAGAS